MFSRWDRQVFVLVGLGHGSIFVIMIAVIWLQSLFQNDEPYVLELVLPPQSAAQTEAVPEQSESPSLPQLTTPEMDSIRELEPLPEPVAEPEPSPTVSYEDWIKNRNMPDRVQRLQRTTPSPATSVPELQTNLRDRLETSLSKITVNTSNLTSASELNALQAYLAEIQSRLQANFRPEDPSLSAEVRFQISGGGRLTSVEFLRSSGNPAFDADVRKAFQSLAGLRPPPGNRSQTMELTFRSRE